jgi:hypothetical protein
MYAAYYCVLCSTLLKYILEKFGINIINLGTQKCKTTNNSTKDNENKRLFVKKFRSDVCLNW